ncbi:MAG: hypothetical protein GY847_03635 [Proteobacteria bacterium]|nr:hypothetical protein [Pseudomonadota bacterium]
MEIEQSKQVSFGTLKGPHLSAVYLLGFVLVYAGERLLGGETSSHWIASSMGGALVTFSCLMWIVAWVLSKGEPRKVEGLSALLSLGGLLALVVYLLGSDLVLGPAPVASTHLEGITTRQILAVVWPIVWVCTVVPLIFVQWSSASMVGGQSIETGRVRASALSGAVTAVLLSNLFMINAIANRKDIRVDLSYFKTTTPSEATRELVGGMDQDTQALLFFPTGSEVLEEVRPYFEELGGLSQHFEVSVFDPALEPEMTNEHRITKDGIVVLVRGQSSQKIELGGKMKRAKRKLRTLDTEFQKAILKMTMDVKTVYMIVGHGERGERKVEGDIRSPIGFLNKFLGNINLVVKKLGPVDGLAREVPDDAALLIWADPSLKLFPGEAESLKTYLRRGGRMLLTLDPDSNPQIDEFLEFLGLTYSPSKLAHERAFIPLTRTPADKYNLITNTFSSHPSVGTLSLKRNEVPILLPGAGSFKKILGTKRRITFVIRSATKTWADANGDYSKGEGEIWETHKLAASITAKVEKETEEVLPGKEEQVKKKEAKKNQKPISDEMRVMVLADTDAIADDYVGFRISRFGHPGNVQLIADALKWLIGEGRVRGVPESEEDVKITHTRDEDVFWFYATVFAVPLIIVGIGLSTRWGRGRKRRAGK